MKTLQYRAIAIKSLQEAISGEQATPPPKGWLWAVREGLGLSRAALARRLDVSPSAIQSFEQSEARGAITLQSMRKLADALECEVVVKLVPRGGRSFVDLAALHDPGMAALHASEAWQSLAVQAPAERPQDTPETSLWLL